MITDYEKRIIEESDLDEEKKKELFRRTEEGEPLAYLLGYWYFWRDRFFLNEECLIPRPDTETVVEAAVETVKKGGTIADLCTGSGCIGLSILRERRDIASCVGVDISVRALESAARNSESMGLTDRFYIICADVLNENPLKGKYDCIISNPPYIRSDEINNYEGLQYEPRAALDGGKDGLTFYRRIVEAYSNFLTEDGLFIFEIGFDQAKDIKEIASGYGYKCIIKKDYGGNDRAALLYKQEN